MDFNQLLNADLVTAYIVPWGTRIVLALAIFFVGKWLAGWLRKLLEKVMTRSRMDNMLVSFLGSIAYTLMLAVVVMAALDRLGVNTTSAIAILGAAGLAVGLALQNSLSNFAAGVMLIVFRPFKTGDFVEAAGISGKVVEVRIFSTVLLTGDNRQIIIPNGRIYDGTIINYSAMPTRRIDLVFGIGYDDDIRVARETMMQVMQDDKRILSDPAPVILVSELGDSSVNFTVRPWVNSGDYWNVRSDLLENVKAAFETRGISIPFPQRDVHLHEVGSSTS